jgi:outer membrane lipoprotein-sorting protein
MKPADETTRLVKHISFRAGPGTKERLWADTARASRLCGAVKSRRGRLVHNRMTRYIAAAAVLLVGALLIRLLGGSPDGAGVTLAQVLSQLREVRPYAVTVTRRFHQSNRVDVRRIMVLNEYQRREEFPDGTVWIFDFSRDPMVLLKLDPATKQAVQETLADRRPRPVNRSVLEELRHYEENPDAYRIADRGIQEMDGHRTKCFQVLREQPVVDTIWVDIKTRLPVRIECERRMLQDTLIMTEYDFAPQFDRRQFEPVLPPGYTLAAPVAPKEEQATGGFRPRRYTETAREEDGTTEVAHFLEPSIDRCRREYAHGLTEIYDFSQQPHRMLRLDAEKKEAVLETYPDDRRRRINTDFLEILEHAEAAPELYRVEDRGFEAVEGRTTHCLYIAGRQGEISATFWVDANTGLPVRVEMRRDKALVYSDFEFDAPLDPNLFALQAPAGYTLTEVVYPAKVAQPTEAHLLAGLRAIAEFLGGAFPQDLGWPEIQEQMRAYAQANEVEISAVQLKDLRTAIEPFNECVGRLRSAPQSFDLHYAGDGVRLGDAQAAILWYRPEGAANYHVVYGDLSVEEATPEDVPRE